MTTDGWSLGCWPAPMRTQNTHPAPQATRPPAYAYGYGYGYATAHEHTSQARATADALGVLVACARACLRAGSAVKVALSHLITLALYHNNTQIPALRKLRAHPLL